MKIELAASFDALQPAALARAVTFVLGWPELFGASVQLDLAYHPKRHALVAVARVEQPSHDARWRFAFWCAHLGARALTPAALSEEQQRAFAKHVADCPMRVVKVEAAQLFSSMKKVLGADADGALDPDAALELQLAVGAGTAGEPTIVVDGDKHSIHVPSLNAPPINDRLRVALLLSGERHVAEGIVTSVVRPANASPARPAGFVVRFGGSAKLAAALKATFAKARATPAAALEDQDARRGDARVPIQAPVKVGAPPRVARAEYETDEALLAVSAHLEERRLPVDSAVRPPVGTTFTLDLFLPGQVVARGSAVVAAHEAAGILVTFALDEEEQAKLAAALARARAAGEPAAASTSTSMPQPPMSVTEAPQRPRIDPPKKAEPREAKTATITYESEEALAADYVENLSKGGAFIKTETPAAMDSTVSLDIQLPDGAALQTTARVVWIGNGGMGVQFQLEADVRQRLDAVLERISTPPRRALVILADAALATEVVAGLASSSFHVVRADGKDDGLSTFFDELLDLDLLVVDAAVADGRSIVDIVRDAGETDLRVVAVGDDAPRADTTVDTHAGVAAIVAACVETAARKR